MRPTGIGADAVTTCRLETSVGQVARLMASRRIGAVVVVSEDGRAMGVVTERDLEPLHERDLDPRTPVTVVMDAHAVAITADTTRADAHRRMAEHGCAWSPVVDDRGRLLGVVSADDVAPPVHLHRAS